MPNLPSYRQCNGLRIQTNRYGGARCLVAFDSPAAISPAQGETEYMLTDNGVGRRPMRNVACELRNGGGEYELRRMSDHDRCRW